MSGLWRKSSHYAHKLATFMSTKPELELIPEGELQICQFAGSKIRKVCHNDEWYFSIVDVVAAMTDSTRPSKYWT